VSGAQLQAALVGVVRDLVTTFDAPPVRAAVPYAVVEDAVLARWGGAGIDGREGRVRIMLHDAGERPVRLRGLSAAVEAAVAGFSGDVGEGWRVVALRLVRSRTVRAGGGERWTATSEFAVTIYRED
jgi:hypothetical protein